MRSTLSTFNEVWQRKFRASFLKQLQNYPEDIHFLIGCSGGMDSMLLLHLMSELVPQRIRIITVNHQLQQTSDAWVSFVQAQALSHNIPIIVEKVDVRAGNLENQAREARYFAFKQHLKSNDVLVLAHHQQDQAETVILRLLSGAGVKGLSGMKRQEQRPDVSIWRPFLDMSREQICQWVSQLQIPYVDDPTNLDTHYDRAWCRHELWHILQGRFPQMQQALSRASYLMQDADDILNEVYMADLAKCVHANQLNLVQLSELTQPRQRQLLSGWMKGDGVYRPSFDMVQRLTDEVIHSKKDAQAALHWNDHYYVRYQHLVHRLDKNVYLADREPQQDIREIQISLNNEFELQAGIFKIETQEIGLSFDLFNRILKLQARQGGEKIHLYGRVGTWPLKKSIQEAQIFPWMRHTIQILSIDNVMLGVFTPQGFWLAQSPYCEVGGWQPRLISSI